MKFSLIFYSLLLSSALYAQKTLQELRIEENLFIMKIVGVLLLVLAATPFVLRKLRAKAKQEEPHNPQPVEHFAEADAAKLPLAKNRESRDEKDGTDPIEVALEMLCVEHNIPEEERADYEATYRRYLEVEEGEEGEADVKTDTFDINTLLDDATTRIHAIEYERDFELVFDIGANVPPQLIGDADRITEVLLYVLHMVVSEHNSHIIKLRIKRLNFTGSAVHLEIYIPYGKDNYQKENSDLFTLFGDGSSLLGLELYLARAYARLMHGDVRLERCAVNDTAFVIELKLYMSDPSEMRHYRLPSKTMIGHSVLLVDDHVESALAVKNMFIYFKNEVDLLSSKELFSALEMLEDYDIIVIQERYFAHKLIAAVKEIKSSREIKAVSLNKNQDFKQTGAEIVDILDAEICKPVTVQKVFDLLVALYSKEKLGTGSGAL
ncbi:MAG: hypothetical protein MUP09_11115 [Thiovulaceae bacterium]|nr:hypothetical protein [Sulfurimonadaceae bacterium]